MYVYYVHKRYTHRTKPKARMPKRENQSLPPYGTETMLRIHVYTHISCVSFSNFSTSRLCRAYPILYT